MDDLKLVLKCKDKNHGDLYAFNREITDKQKDQIIGYFKKYTIHDYENIMEVEGNPQGWMCKYEDVAKVEEILGITETVEKQKITLEKRQVEANIKRVAKNKAMDEIEQIFTGADRPSKFLKKLLKKAQVVYDPQDIYYTDHDIGEGQLYIIDKDNYIWYILNNSRDEDDYTLNNIKTDGKGAVGFRVRYDEHLHDLIKIVSDENIYKG